MMVGKGGVSRRVFIWMCLKMRYTQKKAVLMENDD